MASQAHTIAASRNDFNMNSFCLATDCENVSTVSSSGQNVQGVESRIEGNFLADGLNNANSGIARVFSTCTTKSLLKLGLDLAHCSPKPCKIEMGSSISNPLQNVLSQCQCKCMCCDETFKCSCGELTDEESEYSRSEPTVWSLYGYI